MIGQSRSYCGNQRLISNTHGMLQARCHRHKSLSDLIQSSNKNEGGPVVFSATPSMVSDLPYQ